MAGSLTERDLILLDDLRAEVSGSPMNSKPSARSSTATARTATRTAWTPPTPWEGAMSDADDAVPRVPDPEEIPTELRERDQWLMFDTANDVPRRPHWRGNFCISWSDPELGTVSRTHERPLKNARRGASVVMAPTTTTRHAACTAVSTLMAALKANMERRRTGFHHSPR